MHTHSRAARVFLVAVALLASQTAAAQNDMCMPGIGGLAGTPTIDGIVDGYTGPGPLNFDAGWNGATRWNLSGDNGATTAAKLQTGIAGGFLYLSWVVDTPVTSGDDTIVVGFSTSAGAATDWRIHITPFDTPPADNSGLAPFTIVYWRDSGTWNSGGIAQNANGLWPMLNTSVSKAGNRWAVEMRVPLTNNIADAAQSTQVYLPASGTFRFYTNVLSTFGFVDMTVVQDPWPAGVIVAGGDILENHTPAVASWGVASFNTRPQCDAVELTWADIGVEFPANSGTIVSNMRRSNAVVETTDAQCSALPDVGGPSGPNNVYIARPRNLMSTQANNVTATYHIAYWGIPGVNNFDVIGLPGSLGVSNHPAGPQNITSGNQISLRSNWALTYKQSCFAKVHPHQCMQVEIDSNDPATRFRNKSVQRNMDFVPASINSRIAVVSGDQGRLPKGRDAHRFILFVDTDQQLTRGATPPAQGQREKARFRSDELLRVTRRDTRVAQFAFIVRGIVLRDDFLIINKHKYQLGERAGDFGLIASHRGPFQFWDWSLSGKGLRRTEQKDVFTLDVRPGDAVELRTLVSAVEKRRRD
jgi:hypothetical protein